MLSKKFLVFLFTTAILLHLSNGQQDGTESDVQASRAFNLWLREKNFNSETNSPAEFIKLVAEFAEQVQERQSLDELYSFLRDAPGRYSPHEGQVISDSELKQTTLNVKELQDFVDKHWHVANYIVGSSQTIEAFVMLFHRKMEFCTGRFNLTYGGKMFSFSSEEPGARIQSLEEFYKNEIREKRDTTREERNRLFDFILGALKCNEVKEKQVIRDSQLNEANSSFESFSRYLLGRADKSRKHWGDFDLIEASFSEFLNTVLSSHRPNSDGPDFIFYSHFLSTQKDSIALRQWIIRTHNYITDLAPDHQYITDPSKKTVHEWFQCVWVALERIDPGHGWARTNLRDYYLIRNYQATLDYERIHNKFKLGSGAPGSAAFLSPPADVLSRPADLVEEKN